MEPLESLNLEYWKVFLDYDVACDLVARFSEFVSSFSFANHTNCKLWRMSAKAVKYKFEHYEIERFENISDTNVTRDILTEEICRELRQPIVVLSKSQVDIHDKLMVVETQRQYLEKNQIPKWELSFLMEYPEIDCFNCTLACLKPFLPTYAVKSNFFTYSIHTRCDANSNCMEITGRIYIDWKMYSDSFPYEQERCQQFHRILIELKSSTLPEIQNEHSPLCTKMTFGIRHNLELEPAKLLSLPIVAPFEYFLSHVSNYKPIITLIPFNLKMENYIKLANRNNLEGFLQSRESSFVGDWFCHRISDSFVISPYSTEINSVRSRYAVAGGVIFGDAMAGKTHFMTKRTIQLALTENKPSLIFSPPYDKKIIISVLQEFTEEQQDQVGYYFQWSDYANRKTKDVSKLKVIILNSKFAVRSNIIRKLLERSQFKRLIIDQFDQTVSGSNLFKFINQSIQSDIIWLITSKMTPDLITSIWDYLKLYDYLNVGRTNKSLSRNDLPDCAVFSSLCYHIVYGNNQLTRPVLQATYQTIPTPRRYDLYPFEQVTVAIRETLEHSACSRHIKGLLTLLSALDSGVPQMQRDVKELLLNYSFHIRAGGSLFIPIPEFIMLKHESKKISEIEDTLCAICREEMQDPVRNIECCHILCYECMKEWNQIHSSCPLCRADFKTEFIAVNFTDMENINMKSVKRKQPEMSCDKESLHIILMRGIVLKSILQQDSFNKILIITHWRQMLHMYLDIANNAVKSDCQVEVISKKINYSDCKSIDKLVNNSQVIVTHSDNIKYFRNDSRFQQVIFMDNDVGEESLATWYNYFRNCTSRIYFYSEGSVEQMLLDQMKGIIQKNTGGCGNNVVFPKRSLRALLSDYQDFCYDN